jgi:CBS domain-containing protein
MPDRIARSVLQKAEPLYADETVGSAVRMVLETGLPGLPAVEVSGAYAGVFGPDELISAYFPAYVRELHGARMISPDVEEALERRLHCGEESVRGYLNTDNVVVEEGYSDFEIAALFLHHRVQVIPVSTQGRIDAVVCLEDFFRALAEHVASARPESGSRHRSCAYTADTTCSSVASVRPS